METANVERQILDGAVGIDPQDVHARTMGLDHVRFGRVESRDDRHRGVVRIHLMDEGGDLFNGLPHLEIGVPQVHLVADAPDQNGRMVLVLEDLGFELLNLGTNGILVIVIHARSFGADIQTERHGHVIPER